VHWTGPACNAWEPANRAFDNLYTSTGATLSFAPPFLLATGTQPANIAIRDIDGDGLGDLLVAEPDSGQLSLYVQREDGSLGQNRVFATLTDALPRAGSIVLSGH